MRRTRFRRQWFMPVILAVLTTIGLACALLGDGPWDWLSWFALALPLVAVIWIFGGWDGTRHC